MPGGRGEGSPLAAVSEAPVIETAGLTKDFGRLRAVDQLSLSVARGELFGFLGPNGAGKSTTIRMLLGLVRPTAGSASLFGLPVRGERLQIARRVGAIVEKPVFYDYLSGWRNLKLFSDLSGGVAADQIEHALKTVGLWGRERDRVGAYSQGMRQRLGLARALLPEPELLVLDEPASGLDPEGLAEVRDLLRRLAQERGITVFLSSHLLHEVEQICTDVGVISRGRLIARGKVPDLLGDTSQRLRIEVDAPARALEIIRRLDFCHTPTMHPSSVEVSTTREQVPRLNAILVQSGLSVYALVPQRRSLEELYLTVMQEDETANAIAS